MNLDEVRRRPGLSVVAIKESHTSDSHSYRLIGSIRRSENGFKRSPGAGELTTQTRCTHTSAVWIWDLRDDRHSLVVQSSKDQMDVAIVFVVPAGQVSVDLVRGGFDGLRAPVAE